MLTSIRRMFARATIKTTPTTRFARLNLSRLEARDVPALTSFSIEPVPDVHLTPGAHDIVALQFVAKSTNSAAGLVNLYVDDVVEGSLSKVANATLEWESSPGAWTVVDSSPVSHGYGDYVVFNHFGKVPTGDNDGERFRVLENALTTGFNPVHAELGITSAGVAYGGTRIFSAIPAPGNVAEEVHVPTSNGYPRTLHNIVPLGDVTVTANDRDKVVYDVWKFSSDPRAFENCIRFRSKDGGALRFIRTASLYLEISPGVWDRVMTVRPDGYGRLIFTHYLLGRKIPTSGTGAHLQVRVDADPTMTGAMPVNIYQYLSTMPHSGRFVFNSYTPGTNGGGGGGGQTGQQLSASGTFYPGVVGTQFIANCNVSALGSGTTTLGTMTFNVATGSGASVSNMHLYLLDSNDVPIGNAIGGTASVTGNTITITAIGYSFTNVLHIGLLADLSAAMQIDGVTATT